MTARAIWKGVIRLEEIAVPVKLYSAVQDQTIHFRLLHAADNTPVKQEMVHPETGEVVPKDQIRHGYMTEDGRMVILAEEELQKIEPAPSRDIRVVRFLPASLIDHRWYERPYYLGPDGDYESYFALSAALREFKTEALVQWVMRNKEYSGVLRLHGAHPVLITLKQAEEVVLASELNLPAPREINEKELAMAEQLIGMLEDRFDLAAYRDEYRLRLMRLIESKSRGEVIELQKVARKKITVDLEEALAASLKAVKERRSA